MYLLKRYGIELKEVNEYKIYPIADNDTPNLSADRLEYTFSDNLTLTGVWNLNDVKKLYNNITILKNEKNIDELGFSDIEIAEEFVKGASSLWYFLQSNKDKLKCQFIADTIKSMNKLLLIYKDDLYIFTEQ